MKQLLLISVLLLAACGHQDQLTQPQAPITVVAPATPYVAPVPPPDATWKPLNHDGSCDAGYVRHCDGVFSCRCIEDGSFPY